LGFAPLANKLLTWFRFPAAAALKSLSFMAQFAPRVVYHQRNLEEDARKSQQL
jgi:hypothetical protein